MTKPRETFHFNQPISIEGPWMIGLLSLEVYISVFNITEENNKIELYKFTASKKCGISYEKVRHDIGRDLAISKITGTDLQGDIMGPFKQKSTKNDKYMDILAGCTSSVFQDFKSFLKTEVDLVEDDIRLGLDEYISGFVS